MAAAKTNIKKDDTVMVITGKNAGKTGKVLQVLPGSGKVVVEGFNIVKRHTKPTQKNPQGGIMEKPAAISISNVMLYCGKCKKVTRVSKNTAGERVCKHCGEVLK